MSAALTDSESGVVRLTDSTRRLAALMSAPHPGLMTWRDALANVIDEIAEYNGHSHATTDAMLAALKAVERPFNFAILRGQISGGTENSIVADAIRAAIEKAEANR